MNRFLLFPAIILFSLLCGCVGASEILSESLSTREATFNDPHGLDSLQIGQSTREHVLSLLGKPTNVQAVSEGHTTRESWAYVSADHSIQPFQYIPFLGALTDRHSRPPKAFAVSFTPEGIVSGFTVSEFQAQGLADYPFTTTPDAYDGSLYGIHNVLARN